MLQQKSQTGCRERWAVQKMKSQVIKASQIYPRMSWTIIGHKECAMTRAGKSG